MFGSNNVPSIADIAAVTDNNRGYNDGFGGGGAWWAWIIILALFGWGGFGGMGGYGRGAMGSYETQAEVQRGFDTQAIISKLDGINNGICSLGYDQLAQMNGINNTIMQTGFGLSQQIQSDTVANMQNTNALSRQLQDCCCENRAGLADLKYTMATDTCAITTAIERAAQNIMQNDNANYRQLHDENVQMMMAQKDEKIAEQANMINALNLAQSQANQNQFFQSQLTALGNRLDPCPVPAYWVNNPHCCQNPWENLNFNRGCGDCRTC